MIMKLLTLSFLFISSAQAYTLNNNFGANFKDHRVKVFVSEATTCFNNSLTYQELEGLVAPAVDTFWNEVPTSNLELVPAGFSKPVHTMNQGRLCSPTDDECIAEGTAAGDVDSVKGVIPPVDGIVIACNSNNDNFENSNVLAVTIPNKFSGKKIGGAVILINEASSAFGGLSYTDQVAVIAHEIGHAIGLGHSEDTAALMYYRTVDLRRSLGQDDIDGVSFLYPKKLDGFGLLGGCGTITDGKNPPKDPPFWQMGISLGLLILIFEILKLLRSKTRTAA